MQDTLAHDWRKRMAARSTVCAMLLAVPVLVAALIGFSAGPGGLPFGISSLASGPGQNSIGVAGRSAQGNSVARLVGTTVTTATTTTPAPPGAGVAGVGAGGDAGGGTAGGGTGTGGGTGGGGENRGGSGPTRKPPAAPSRPSPPAATNPTDTGGVLDSVADTVNGLLGSGGGN